VKEVQRARREFARHAQKREPLRIVITGDPRRPIRTIVIPARLPFVAVGAAAAVVLVAVGLAFAAWSLRGAVGRLSLRMSAMTDAADELARYPLPAAAGLLNAAALDAGSWRARARPERHVPPERLGRLELQSVNTGEHLIVSLDTATGEPDEQSYRAVRRFMRCLRTGAETPMDPRLIELLYRISQRAGRKIQLVSGFRAPMYSAVAFSYHPRGMAADIRIPGMTALMVRDLVSAMGVKGVGYYPTSQFVHVDVRDTRAHWTDYSTKSDEDSSSHGESQPAPP
jgi:uncharacterized protein YcbK (DUF882 family)